MLYPVYQIKCAGCKRVFDWIPREIDNIPPNYHSRACKNRKRIKQQTKLPSKCPHPWKRVYATHEDAQRACAEIEDAYLRPYRCRCGGIHIGHNKSVYIRDWIER
jgi:hypothetical protein